MTLTEAFAGLQDPRTGPAQRHDLREMILMALCAVLCGADTWVDAADWAEDNETWLRHYLVLERGTPSHDTFGRVFRILDATIFEQCFRGWIADMVGVIDGVVALDGAHATVVLVEQKHAARNSSHVLVLVEPPNPTHHSTQWTDRGAALSCGSICGFIVGNFDYEVMDINRCETRFHRHWCIRQVLMLSIQNRQQIAGNWLPGAI